MTKVINTLYEMQKLDDKIGRKDILTRELPKKLNDLIESVKKAEIEVTNLKNLLDNNRKSQKLKELEIKSNNSKIAKFESQSIDVKTNKEIKALNSEIFHLKEINNNTDDELVEMMLEEEALIEKLKNAKSKQKEVDKALKKDEEKIKEQIKQVNAEILDLKNKRNGMAKQNLQRQLIKRYASLIKHKDRKAIVFNHGGACSGCGFKIRAQVVIEINKGDKLVSCENCGRYLIKKPDNE